MRNVTFESENLKGEDPLEDQSVEGIILLNLISSRQGLKILIVFRRLRIGSAVDNCKLVTTFGLHEGKGFPCEWRGYQLRTQDPDPQNYDRNYSSDKTLGHYCAYTNQHHRPHK